MDRPARLKRPPSWKAWLSGPRLKSEEMKLPEQETIITVAPIDQRCCWGIWLDDEDGSLHFVRCETPERVRSICRESLISDGICAPNFSKDDARKLLLFVREQQSAEIERLLAKWKAEDETESEA